MNDVDFCKAFVSKLIELGSPPSKTNIQMRRIVNDKQFVDINNMFDDESLKKLFGRDVVTAFVYSFIRDNQQLFVN